MAPRLIARSMSDLFVQDRTPGLHVTSAIYKAMRGLYPDRFDGSPINDVRAMLGNALENAIADELAESDPDRYISPGELVCDGVRGTPDLLDLNEWAPIEIKLTWASSRRAEDIEDSWFWRYWTQLKTYAHMLGSTKGYLYIVFINGNYSYNKSDPESQPQMRVWEETWTKEELCDTWEFIKANVVEET